MLNRCSKTEKSEIIKLVKEWDAMKPLSEHIAEMNKSGPIIHPEASDLKSGRLVESNNDYSGL